MPNTNRVILLKNEAYGGFTPPSYRLQKPRLLPDCGYTSPVEVGNKSAGVHCVTFCIAPGINRAFIADGPCKNLHSAICYS